MRPRSAAESFDEPGSKPRKGQVLFVLAPGGLATGARRALCEVPRPVTTCENCGATLGARRRRWCCQDCMIENRLDRISAAVQALRAGGAICACGRIYRIDGARGPAPSRCRKCASQAKVSRAKAWREKRKAEGKR